MNNTSWFDMSTASRIVGNTGRNRLFEMLRKREVLSDENQPKQCYVDKGLFKTGLSYQPHISQYFPVTLVSIKGIEFIQKIKENYSKRN